MAAMSEFAWAGGLFEGEGCFSVQRNKQRGTVRVYPKAVLAMKDEAIVRQFAAVMGVGRVYGTQRVGYTMWSWQTTSRADWEMATALLLPWLGERRTLQAKTANTLATPIVRKSPDLVTVGG